MQFIKSIGKAFAAATAFTGATTGLIGIYGSQQINISRKRWFTDDFVLTPETLRMPYKQVSFTTEDDVELNGWLIEQTVRGKPSDRVVMCCNPYFHDKSTLLGVARGLWESGYTVLLYDFRSFAPTPVKQETIGYLERRDGLAALRWLHANKPKDAKVGLMGASMGGAVALMLAQEDASSVGGDVVCCATDCAFYSLRDVVEAALELQHPSRILVQIPILKDLILESLCTFNELWYGYNPANVGPKRFVKKLDVPLLLLHSENDQVVPVDQAYHIYHGASTPEEDKKLIIYPEVHHIGAYFQNEGEYVRRIVKFLDESFEKAEKKEPVAEEADSKVGLLQDRVVLLRHPSLSTATQIETK